MVIENGFSHQSLSSRVVDYLKNEIFLGNYQGGDRILESRVAEELNISRAPVREAFKELENEGLLCTRPRKGSFIVDFSEDDIREIFDIRVLLEIRLIETIINRNKLDGHDYNQLTAIVDRMVNIARDKGEEQNLKLIKVNQQDIAFHQYLWEKSGSKWTIKILHNILNQLQLAMIIDSKLEESLEESAAKHYDLIKYIREKDLTKIRKVLIDHIVSFKEELKVVNI